MDFDDLKALLPYLIITAIVAVLASVATIRFLPIAAPLMAQAVTFDIIKYTNAQRAVASSLLKQQDKGEGFDAVVLLRDINAKTKGAIAKAAGSRMVLIRQAVVDSTLPDITDTVLSDLGLPTDVPSQTMEFREDVAPTMSGFSQAQRFLIGPSSKDLSTKESDASLSDKSDKVLP